MSTSIGTADIAIEDERFARLPKWAQDRITRAENSADYWKEKHLAGPEDSDTFVHEYTRDGNGGKPLGTGPDIRFDLPGGGYIMANLSGDRVRIRGMSPHGESDLAITPRSSNVIEIAVPGR